MEVEVEARVKPLAYKVKAMSRESPQQKAAHVLDTDLRNHWSTGTNTKEWILLELDEPCLLSHIRIYNKSVLEWEISAGLRYKPETFAKVRPRCEAPRRDMVYPMNYTPCRYVRISCMRGNPIALFFIQLIGISVPGLEPEFHPVANHLLPHIISHKQDTVDMHLQLLQDVTRRLSRFLPHIEADLNNFAEAAEPTMHFLAMLAGPCYPILYLVSESETTKLNSSISDNEPPKTSQPSAAFTVSSNFEPRRSRNTSPVFLRMSRHLVFRPDAVFLLLRKAYKNSTLGSLCMMVSKILLNLEQPMTAQAVSTLTSEVLSREVDENSKSEPYDPISIVDYSKLFGEGFCIPEDFSDPSYINVLDSAAVEEGLMHVLYASASQALHCKKLVENSSDFWLALPLVQALLPALRPNVSSPCQIDENFLPWKQPIVQDALSQIVATSSSVNCHPLLRACAGYLSSFSPSHAKAACVLIDLCSGILAPWTVQVIAKVELTIELLEDLIGVIQGARHSLSRARAALIYIVLALSGNMDDIMAKYKEAKHKLLFLLEMLEPYLEPALAPLKGIIAFGNVSSISVEKQEETCAIAVNVIRMAIKKSVVLPSLEAEWRRGSVAPSVLLLVLDADMQLPPDIDQRKFSSVEMVESISSAASPHSSHNWIASYRSNNQDTADAKVDFIDVNGKTDIYEDATLLFAPPELNRSSLAHVPTCVDITVPDSSHFNLDVEAQKLSQQFPHDAALMANQGLEFYNFLADYSHLTNYCDCELRASEFRRLAMDLNSQNEIDLQTHDVAIDALLLAAECYINPCFMKSVSNISSNISKIQSKSSFNDLECPDIERIIKNKDDDVKLVADIEKKRDRVVLEILIEAAEFDRKFHESTVEEVPGLNFEGHENIVNLSQEDIPSADAITLVRQNQALLCKFLVHRLWRDLPREQNPTHDILMWCLLFILHSATKLFCAPEDVVGIILKYAESLNVQLKEFDFQFKEEHSQFKLVKKIEIHRRWILLHKLVIASSGSDERSLLSIDVKSCSRFSNLIPSSSWLLKVPVFSSSIFPLVRYFGWMAVARNAKQYLGERFFLVSDLSQITYLLSIFSDDLSFVDSIVEQKEMSNPMLGIVHQDISVGDAGKTHGHQDGIQSFCVLYPDLSRFFPNVRKDFVSFGEIILEAVGLQLKFLSSTIVPDLMCWFSDLCLWPLGQRDSDYYKGFVAKNAKAVILYVLEAIIAEHMEAMVPEMPRVVQVLVSLCRTSYCDVSFLDSVLRLLKPVIAYSLNKVPLEEKTLAGDSCTDLESLCFGELFDNIKCNDKNEGTTAKIGKCQALTIFILATIFDDLSFHRKKLLLISATSWAEFAEFDGMNHFHDFICAYQVLMEKCKDLFKGSSRRWGLIPLKTPSYSDTDTCYSKSPVWFLNDTCNLSPPTEMSEHHQHSDYIVDATQNVCRLNLEETTSLSQDLEVLILKLNPTIEQCWKLHPKLSKKLALTSAESFIYSRWLSLIIEKVSGTSEACILPPSRLVDDSLNFGSASLEGLAKMILMLQENHCWEVASLLLDSLLGVPRCFRLDNVSDEICLAVKSFSNSAPNISWRLLADKFISLLVARGIHNVCQNEVPLVDLFCYMLGHPEPEQRYIALKHLSRLVGQDVDGGFLYLSSVSESILSPLVSATWDYVALIASSDTSMPLRTSAIALLIHFVPFVERRKLQSFLAAADSILQCLTTLSYPKFDSPLTRFSLALIASVCLYASAEDISLIPESIWRNLETLGMSRKDSYCSSIEQKACEALCGLRRDEEGAKQLLEKVLSSSSPRKEQIPDFVTTRESILQVIGNLSSARSYFDFFSEELEEKNMELEEAEVELELSQKEVTPKAAFDFQDWRQLPFMSAYAKNDQRLQHIKDQIRSIEKVKLREEIVARRQQKLLARQARSKFLEEAALREVELVQKLDREKTNETEKELERQQMLEVERAKTRELRHNLEMEKEKQAQRDLQRELEQVESGIRPSRREIPSSSHSRALRDRHRERDNRNVQPETSPLPFSGQSPPPPPIILMQSREDCVSTTQEENLDSGGSIGDPESISTVDGLLLQQSSGFGRHGGSRGGKSSRQIVDSSRKEREGRREGKWERKHS